MSTRSSAHPVRPAPGSWVHRRRSAIHGSGLIAARSIPAGTRIIEYVGERITKAEADRREEARLAQRDAGRDGCVYVFELNARHDIDGNVAWNPARLINHTCEANCEPQVIRGHIWIVALRDIAAGEELGYDYGFDCTDWRDHPCRCGTAACAGYIVKQSQRWRVRRIMTKTGRVAAA